MSKLTVKVKSWLLVVIMVFGICGVLHMLSSVAYADEDDSMLQEETTDCLESDDRFDNDGKPHIHDGIEFKPWTDSTRLPDEPGHFYLTQDVTLSKRYVVPRTYVDICLNGHTITTTDPYDVMIYIGSPSGSYVNLSIFDCEGGAGKITGSNYCAVFVDDNCVFNLHGGCITGNSGYAGPAVQIMSGGVFNMDGGSITGNDGQFGVVAGTGRFNMAGGFITDNNGTGVSVEEFHVSGNPIVRGNALEVDSHTYPSDVAIFSTYQRIIVDGVLDESASIGVDDAATTPIAEGDIVWPVVFTSGLSGNGSANSFVSNLELAIATSEDGEAAFYIPLS